MCFQGVKEWNRHGVADDGDRVDLFLLDDAPHLLPKQMPVRVEHHFVAAEQLDHGIPPARAVHQRRQRHPRDWMR